MKHGRNNDLPFAKRCSCGAITVMVLDSDGRERSMSMPEETYNKYFSEIPLEPDNYGNCNYCVNHWGVDLCGCGSGEQVGECENHYDHCKSKVAAQELITEYILPSFKAIEE